MPTTVTASNGQNFHLWQLDDLSADEIQDEISYTVLKSEQSEAYRERLLIGLPGGLRTWTLNLPRNSGSGVRAADVTDPDGASVTREQYIRNLYKKNKITGVPFVYSDVGQSGQYYLVDFADEPLSMRKKKGINIYGTTVKLVERRINGVSVFNIALLDLTTVQGLTSSLWQWLKASTYSSPSWPASYNAAAQGTGDVAKVTAAQNGQDIVRLNAGAGSGYVFTQSVNSAATRELFIVMKMREATFSSNAGIFTGSTSAPVLVGASGTTKFQNQGFGTGFTYELNGVPYAEADQQAPMNQWGVVHVRYTGTAWATGSGYFYGRDRSTSNYAKVDIGEVVLCFDTLPEVLANDITQYLVEKWGIEIGHRL